MGKISPVSAKYIIHTKIDTEGVVDKPDVIGAIFGQTEGLLGADLELRELQRSGRIGRIEVKTETSSGKTSGVITIPSSLDKTETAIIAAALETIQRIGPCNSRVKVETIEDVRVSKRNFVIERAKELLKELTESVLPDSQEIADQVSHSVRIMEVREYGKDRLAAGPAIDESEDIIVVEGRADVLNLLKHGFKNVIAMNGTSVPDTIKELSRRKTITAFVDGDRGGDLIIKALIEVAEIDYVCKAPSGIEVEELTKKELHKALRGRVAVEQVKLDLNGKEIKEEHPVQEIRKERLQPRPLPVQQTKISDNLSNNFKSMLEDLVGTRGAYLLDEKGSILGKVPTSELNATLAGLKGGIYAVVLDGSIDRNLASIAERASVKFLVGMNSRINPRETRVEVLTARDF